MFDNYFVLDFESYYNSKQGYTLKKMTPVEYVLDHRFELIGCAVIECRHKYSMPAYWVDGPDFPTLVRKLRAHQKSGGKIIVMSHNALFDMCILVWRYGLLPDLMVDTMSMAQTLLYPKIGFVSLAKVADFLGIGVKGDTVAKVDGMTRQMIIDAGMYDAYSKYSLNDAVICERIFQHLDPKFPRGIGYLWMDTIIRCAVLPGFKLDQEVLYDHLAKVKLGKAELLANAGVTVDEWGKAPELMSNDKFADLLEAYGVEPPMKISLATGKQTYAFAKTDQGMADLQEHDDPDVQALVAARLGVKSTIEETRTERFISISNLQWPGQPEGQAWMPIALKVSGAHTHRLSGQWKLNQQNLPRGGRLRDSIRAPQGFVVVACDASQIEARLAAWLASVVLGEVSELVEAFARGDDVYSLFATKQIYKRLITKFDIKERFVGKQAILGLGFGMGHKRYRIQVRKDSRLQLKIEIVLTEQQAKDIVHGYRFGMAPQVPKAWKTLTNLLPVLQHQDSGYQFGPMTFRHQEIIGPTGFPLFYPGLEQHVTADGNEWQFKSGRMTKRLFGGKLYENIIQHLAWCCNVDTALKVRKHFGIDLKLQAHDELAYIVPGGIEEEVLPNGKIKRHATGFAKEFMVALHSFMRERPSWGLTLPLDAEAGVGYTYGDAK